MVGSLIFYACVDEEITGKDPDNVVIGMDPPPEENESHADTLTATRHSPSNSTIPSNNGLSVNNNTLIFARPKNFGEIYESLLNKKETIKDAWELSIGFSSLWTYYFNLEQDSTYDDWASDSLRSKNKILERLLNENQEYIIGDSTFTYDFINGEVKAADNNTGSYTTYPIGGAWKTNNGCFRYHDEIVDKVYSGPWKILSIKAVDNNPNIGYSYEYSHVYSSMVHYRKNTLGIFKKKNKRLTIFLDKWHEMVLEIYKRELGQAQYLSQEPTITISDDLQYENNVSWFQHDYFFDAAHGSKITHNQACIPKWERLHCYTFGNFEKDVHNDDWNW